MTAKERLLIIILASINFTHIMDFMVMMPLGAYLMPLFKISPQQFSLLVSAYTFAASIVGFSAAFFVDKFDRKKVLLTGYTGFVVGTFLCALAPSYELLLTARIIAGGFGGLIGAQVFAIIGDVIPFERRGRAMGMLMGAFSFAAAIGVPSGLFLAKTFSWRAPFWAVGGLGLVIIPLVMRIVPRMDGHIQTNAPRSNPLRALTAIAQNPNQQRALLLMFTMMIAHFVAIPFIAPYLEFNVGFTKDNVTLMYFIGGSITLITSPIVGRLVDKYGTRALFTVLVLVNTIPVFLLTNMPRIPFYYVLIVTAFFFIFSGGRAIPLQTIMTSVVSPEQRGSFMSINTSLQQLASGLAALIAGFIVAQPIENGALQHYNYVGYISIFMSIVCIFVVQTVKVNTTK